MKTGTSDGVDEIATAISLRQRPSGSTLAWFGEDVARLHDDVCAPSLARVIYRWALCVGGPRPWRHPELAGAASDARPAASPRWLEAWDPGWVLEEADDGLLGARKGSEPCVRVGRSLIRPVDAAAGSVVELRVPPVSAHRLPGWVTLSSGVGHATTPLVRLYLNTRRSAADALARRVASRLLDAGIADFTLKWLRAPEHDERCDSTVIYVAAGAAQAAVGAVIRVAARSDAVFDGVPMLTRRLTSGVGMAESPAGGASFGETRSRQVATALVAALRTGAQAAPLDLGFDRRRPWEIHGATPEVAVAVPRRQRRAPRPEGAGEALVRLADDLQREALRSDGRVGWLQRGTTAPFAVRTAGAQVYDGAPGAVLVLAHATRLTEGDRYRPTLRGAAEDVACRAAGIDAVGFHQGAAGTAATLAEAGAVARDERLLQLAASVRDLALTSGLRRRVRGWDVVHGVAGFVLGIVAASKLLGERAPAALEVALTELAMRARVAGGMAHWRTPAGAGRRVALAGLAHGVSGAAMALCVGDRALGSTAHQPLVAAAVRFEDQRRPWPSGGWADHRQPVARPDCGSWCHGAAGIALARAAIVARSGERATLARVEDAIALLAADLERVDEAGGLCHGRAGAALVLHRMSEVLAHPEWRALARDTLRPARPNALADRVSLMTGQAGHALARLAIEEGAPAPLAFVLDPSR